MALTESTLLELGTTAPDFALTDVVTGTVVRRDDARGQKALLVLFICAHCPYVKHIEKELATLGKDYAGKGVSIVAISSNDAATHPDDNPAGLKKQAQTYGFVFPYLYDETQAVAHAYKAACTPDFSLRRRFPPGLSRPVRFQPSRQRSSCDWRRPARRHRHRACR
jgi:peroxiredoxin